MGMDIANPAPLGLLAFAITTALLMYVDMEWAEPELEGLVYGYATWYGGVAQLLVGVAEILKGNAFGAAAFSSYGAFWLGRSSMYIAVQEGFIAGSSAWKDGSALWLGTFGVLTASFWVLTLRKNMCLIVVFGLLALTFFILAGGVYDEGVKKVGGYFGFATALAAFYTAFAELFLLDWGYHVLPGLKPMHEVEVKITTQADIEKRIHYDERFNTLFIDFHNLQVTSESDINLIREALVSRASAPGKKVNAIVNYHGFVVSGHLEEEYKLMVGSMQRRFYRTVRRFNTDAFSSGDQAFPSTWSVDMAAGADQGDPPREKDI